ncbi:MAG TPA: trypsin-like peptidase domain-containing protein [Gammaproteobacteria bacterium]|nr:trypsin-like peptidase domain-containing protein [Gammaproteobacteria bacterium]
MIKFPRTGAGRGFVAACLLLFAFGAAAADLPDFSAVAGEAAPSVVNIRIERIGFGAPPGYAASNGNDDNDATAMGSGIIIDADGYILTCAHVIEAASSVEVTLADGRRFQAKIVGADRDSDLALLKIPAKGLPAAKLGDSDALKAGQWVAAIGSPFGLQKSITVGVVSATDRHLASEKYVPFIQSDVPINPGSSGGPLLNLAGEVVGVNSEIYSQSGDYTGVSFAVPIDLALNVVRQLKADGAVSRGWLGVNVQQVTPTLARATGMPMPVGAVVTDIVKASPAARSGLRPGDIIVSFDGHKVAAPDDLPPLVGGAAVGKPTPMTVLRNGVPEQLSVTIGLLKNEADDFTLVVDTSRIDRFGLVARNLTEDQRRRLDIAYGVLVQYASGAAKRAGIVPGDVILRLARSRVHSVGQLDKLERGLKTGELAPVLVRHEEGTRFVALRTPAP